MYVFVPMIKLSIDLRATSIFIRTLIHLMTYMQWFELCGEQKLQQCCVNWFLQLAWGQLHWSILAMRQTLNTEIYELRPPPFLHRPKISSDVHNAVWLCKNKTSGFPDVPFCVSTCICRWSPEYLFNSGPWHLYAFTNTRLMKCVNKWSFVGSPVPWHFSLNEKKSTMNHSQKQSINPVYSSSSGWKMVSKTEHSIVQSQLNTKPGVGRKVARLPFLSCDMKCYVCCECVMLESRNILYWNTAAWFASFQ